MKQAYTVLSKLYDKLMVDFNYLSYYHFISKYIKGNVLELACGSGMFTKQYADKADKIIALDNCREMLNIALCNNRKNREYIEFIQSDMRTFKPSGKVDTVLCVCDGFNYISQTDLNNLLLNIYNYINNDAYFIFDISSDYKLRQIIGNNVFYEDNDDYTYLWTNVLNNESVDMEITLFNKVGEVYRREDESHTQFIHDKKEILFRLEKVGFEVNVFDGDDFKVEKETSKRLLFICYKR